MIIANTSPIGYTDFKDKKQAACVRTERAARADEVWLLNAEFRPPNDSKIHQSSFHAAATAVSDVRTAT